MKLRLLNLWSGFAYVKLSSFVRKSWESVVKGSFYTKIFWNWSSSLVPLFSSVDVARRYAQYDFKQNCRW